MQLKYFNHVFGLIILFSSIPGYSMAKTTVEAQKDDRPQIVVIKNVNVIPMTPQNEILQDATVLIENGKIRAINGHTPDNAMVIDGKGKWLTPGFIDMHVHTYTDVNFKGNSPTQGANFF